jgi:hypothetical protein
MARVKRCSVAAIVIGSRGSRGLPRGFSSEFEAGFCVRLYVRRSLGSPADHVECVLWILRSSPSDGLLEVPLDYVIGSSADPPLGLSLCILVGRLPSLALYKGAHASCSNSCRSSLALAKLLFVLY